MNFVDQASITVIAGKGGDGRVSFRREKFVSRGGPDGGDGGNGGNIIAYASNRTNSLANFRINKVVKAEAGAPGGNKKKHGKSGQDLVIYVPVGTEVKDSAGQLLADLISEGQSVIVAHGGQGGFGNAHFVSSRRQSPNFAEKGEPGETLELKLELKLLADIGLVGLPNAGKSTLLRVLSNARPKVADYPFTTLEPSVGVVDIDAQTSLLFADIPGLIEGAAEGKGLGHDFLRHIERTSVIIHLIDAYNDDVVKAYSVIRHELSAYSPVLAKQPEVIAINKTEGLDKVVKANLVKSLKASVKPKNTPILLISAKSGLGLKELVFAAKAAKDREVSKQHRLKPKAVFRYSLPDSSGGWKIEHTGDRYLVEGHDIEHFALKTDFNNDQAVARLLDILKKRGVIHALIKAGIKPGDTIDLGGKGEITF
ncbi:GTPase ObgE [Patescibacteria group bacterium]|nr:GTPase ObgE [Patescibacteria group bacterium]